jgi:hypothetical protein
MMQRVANWHGEKAADFYMKWLRTGDPADERDYVRHCIICKKMWKALELEPNFPKKVFV